MTLAQAPARLSRLSLPQSTVRRYLTFAALVAPVFFLRLLTAAYPIGDTVYLSLTNLNFMGGTDAFIGLRNYPALARDYGVRSAVGFTVEFVVASLVLQLAFGLLIAQLLNADFRGRTFARVINLIPWAIPGIVAAYAFSWMLDDQFGMITHWIYLVSGQRPAILITPLGAQLSLILVNVWKGAPFLGIVFLAGFQGVPDELYEAAKVDGANAWQRFWGITIPLVRPLVITIGMFFMIGQLGSFDLIFGLTNGGPGMATQVLALRVYQEGLQFFKFGFASAISMVLALLVAIAGLIGVWLFRKFEVTQ